MDMDKTCDHGTMESRIGRLERANRALVASLALVVALPFVLGAWQAPAKVAKELRAERLAIVDSKGVERITLVGDEHLSGVFFPSPDGKRTLASIDVTSGGAGLALNGPDNQIVMTAGREGGSMFFADVAPGQDADHPRMTFRAVLESDKEAASFKLNDPKGRVLFRAPK